LEGRSPLPPFTTMQTPPVNRRSSAEEAVPKNPTNGESSPVHLDVNTHWLGSNPQELISKFAINSPHADMGDSLRDGGTHAGPGVSNNVLKPEIGL
jgi:hypothetical protein